MNILNGLADSQKAMFDKLPEDQQGCVLETLNGCATAYPEVKLGKKRFHTILLGAKRSIILTPEEALHSRGTPEVLRNRTVAIKKHNDGKNQGAAIEIDNADDTGKSDAPKEKPADKKKLTKGEKKEKRKAAAQKGKETRQKNAAAKSAEREKEQVAKDAALKTAEDAEKKAAEEKAKKVAEDAERKAEADAEKKTAEEKAKKVAEDAKRKADAEAAGITLTNEELSSSQTLDQILADRQKKDETEKENQAIVTVRTEKNDVGNLNGNSQTAHDTHQPTHTGKEGVNGAETSTSEIDRFNNGDTAQFDEEDIEKQIKETKFHLSELEKKRKPGSPLAKFFKKVLELISDPTTRSLIISAVIFIVATVTGVYMLPTVSLESVFNLLGGITSMLYQLLSSFCDQDDKTIKKFTKFIGQISLMLNAANFFGAPSRAGAAISRMQNPKSLPPTSTPKSLPPTSTPSNGQLYHSRHGGLYIRNFVHPEGISAPMA
jgi:hypothetical protein